MNAVLIIINSYGGFVRLAAVVVRSSTGKDAVLALEAL
jgi:hypothetical protein